VFTPLEISVTSVHLLVILGFLWVGLRKSKIEIWSPRSIYALVALAYGVIGPVFFVYTENTSFLGAELRPLFALGELACLLSTLGFMAGFALPAKRRPSLVPPYSDKQLRRLVYYSLAAVLGSMLLTTRGNLAALSPIATTGSSAQIMQEQFGTASAIQNYVFNFVHLSIPGLTLLLLLNIKRPSLARWVLVVGLLLLVVAVFVGFGFRFRIVWILMTMAAAFCIARNWRPGLVPTAVALFLVIQVFGVIGSSRTYFGGLDLSGVRSQTMLDRVEAGLSETTIFFTTAATIDQIPSNFSHTYLDPFWVALTFPIPRGIWADKPTSLTTVRMVEALGGSAEMFESGPAVPYFGEYYIALGWFGLLASAFGFGFGMKRAWVWMLARRSDPLVVTIYATLIGLTQYVYSRGYLAQVLMFFAFSLLPFLGYYWWQSRRRFGAGGVPTMGQPRPRASVARSRADLLT
jgi:hypothetical protein